MHTWSSSRWICSLISWMSESMIFPPWKAGAAKTSSFTGPLKHAGIELSLNVLINTDVQKNNKKPTTVGILTCALCACQWRRRPCGSRDWQSWTSSCRLWCTLRFLHRNVLKNDRTADQRTAGLLVTVKVKCERKSSEYKNAVRQSRYACKCSYFCDV